jgi:tRNA-splicing ligase RtcB
MNPQEKIPLIKLDDYHWTIPQDTLPGMRVPGLIFADEDLIKAIDADQTARQVANVAHLPGIVGHSLAMPDIHWGYGFPIGGVAAVDVENGVVSPGGVGYDINCGVRLLKTNLNRRDVEPLRHKLVEAFFANVPCGVGSRGKIKLTQADGRGLFTKGAGWMVERGFGRPEDLEFTEERGAMPGADPDSISPRAFQRGADQLGTLGSGNHFLEIQVVEKIFDSTLAETLGLALGTVTVMIHTGSRALGHQTCDDHVARMGRAMEKYGLNLPDRQLASAPVSSPEGAAYLGAMAAAANYAWANRQAITHFVRESFESVFGTSHGRLGLDLIYDVAHNIAKRERHSLQQGGETRELLVHRKGATRAFPPGHPDLPQKYKDIGQPVIIPGDMRSGSYLLVGAPEAMAQTFGSTCHGAGRRWSRKKAIRQTKGRGIRQEMEAAGIAVRYRGKLTLQEEVWDAYKDIDHVTSVVQGAGLSRRVVRLEPLAVVKG